jgi:hypothetical protein
MHVAAVFVVESHLNELRAEAARARYEHSSPRRNPLRKLASAAVDSLRAFSAPATPKLDAYPFGS